MKYQKSVIIGASVVILGITGAIVATTQQPATHNKVQSVAVETTQPTNDVAVQSTPSEPIADPSVNEAVPTSSASLSVTAAPSPVVVDPVEQLHQTIVAQATSIAPLFASQFASTSDFIYMQWYCLGRGVTASTPQTDLNQIAGFLVPTQQPDGRTKYQYFSGGCRVNELYR